jgi:hypothetical protein
VQRTAGLVDLLPWSNTRPVRQLVVVEGSELSRSASKIRSRLLTSVTTRVCTTTNERRLRRFGDGHGKRNAKPGSVAKAKAEQKLEKLMKGRPGHCWSAG